MKTLFVTFFCVLFFNTYSQTAQKKNFDDILHGLTTIIKVKKIKSSGDVYFKGQGTGFFYQQYKDTTKLRFDKAINSIDSSTKSVWLITNKHVFLGENYKTNRPELPSNIELYLRKKVLYSDHPIWDTISISKKDLELLTKFHNDSTVDVIAM